MSQNKIFIGNLPFKLGESKLTELFSQFGNIVDIAIPTDRETGRPRGFAFITFESPEDAKNALSFDGKDVEGRNIAVKIAQDKEKR